MSHLDDYVDAQIAQLNLSLVRLLKEKNLKRFQREEKFILEELIYCLIIIKNLNLTGLI